MEIRTATVHLTTPDGKMPAHQASPATGGPYPALIVIMEAFGLNGHIKDVTERWAREGYVSMAPDLYYREGSPVVEYSDLPKAIGFMNTLQDPKVLADLGAVFTHLKGLKEVRADRIGVTGFCMGGRLTFLTSCQRANDVKVAVSFYGGGIAADSPQAPINFADKLQTPILCFFGDKDPLIPMDQVKKIDETLKKLGKNYEVKVYSGATHGFFCNERPSYHPDAAKDAWEKAKAWVAKSLKS